MKGFDNFPKENFSYSMLQQLQLWSSRVSPGLPASTSKFALLVKANWQLWPWKGRQTRWHGRHVLSPGLRLPALAGCSWLLPGSAAEECPVSALCPVLRTKATHASGAKACTSTSVGEALPASVTVSIQALVLLGVCGSRFSVCNSQIMVS